MEILRVLNNNVVQALDDNGEEIILMGKGIAFEINQYGLDASKIEKVFELKNLVLNNHVEKLLDDIPKEYWIFGQKIIDEINATLEYECKGYFLISLVDHIYVSVLRAKDNTKMPDIFGVETKHLYPTEYKLAKKIVEEMKETFACNFDDGEVGYIALHLIYSKMEHGNSEVYNIQMIVDYVLNTIFKSFNNIDKSSIAYERFIIHLKYFAQRIIDKKLEPGNKEFLKTYLALSRDFPKQQDCIQTIKIMLLKDKHYSLNSEEECYLLIHLIKVTTN